MELRKAFLWAVLGATAVLGALPSAGADEPLAVKVEMRHGAIGPKKAAIAAPGEQLDFFVNVHGLKADEKGRLKSKVQFEVCSLAGNLLRTSSKECDVVERKHRKGHMLAPITTTIPLECAESQVKVIFMVHDRTADQKTRHEFLVDVAHPDGAHAIDVAYSSKSDLSIPCSGKFVIGESIFLRYRLMGLEDVKKLKCTLEVLPRGERESLAKMELPFEESQIRSLAQGAPAQFFITLTEKFEGILRLTVMDDGGHKHVTEIPLQVTEPLDEAATFMQMVKKPEAESTKMK